MSCLENEIILENLYEKHLEETLKEFKDVEKAEQKAEKIGKEEI